MTSSFAIMYPDVPQKALVVTSNRKFAENHPLRNAFGGYYRTYARLDAPASSLTITFDLGSNDTRQVDYLILGGISALKSALVTKVILQASYNGIVWQNQLGTMSNFLLKQFDGPKDDDIIFTPGYNDDLNEFLFPARYFRVIIETNGISSQLAFKRLYFGQSLDLGREPSTYDIKLTTEREADTWIYPRGHTIMSKAFYPRHTFNMTFEGISDAKANEVTTTLLDDPYRSTVYLYTDTYKDPLYNNGLMLCRIPSSNVKISKKNNVLNWNDLSVSFEEI